MINNRINGCIDYSWSTWFDTQNWCTHSSNVSLAAGQKMRAGRSTWRKWNPIQQSKVYAYCSDSCAMMWSNKTKSRRGISIIDFCWPLPNRPLTKTERSHASLSFHCNENALHYNTIKFFWLKLSTCTFWSGTQQYIWCASLLLSLSFPPHTSHLVCIHTEPFYSAFD